MSLLRRTLNWNARRAVPGTSSSPGMSGRQLLTRSRHLRLLGTAASGGGPPGNVGSSNVFALALAGVVLGLGGYYVGTRSATATQASSATASPSKPVYGTPEDFARAIGELKTLFSEDTVSTAEDQLKAHGFSPNVHLPGK